MSKDKKVIEKKNWISNFVLIGKPKLSDYTFKTDEHSEKSAWIYSTMNLGIDCGEKCGTVYCEMMGGYNGEQAGVIYAHGKKEDGSDDFKNQLEIDWEDRFDESVLASVGDMSFLTVGIEKDSHSKTFYKKFLSAYDAIAYIQKHIDEDMVLNVKGTLKYSSYQDKTQVRKNIQSIVLSKAEDETKYGAKFTQTILINKDSVDLKSADKVKGIIPVFARVLDYVKEINGVEVKGQYPYNKTFDYEIDLSNESLCKTVYEKLFKVKKNVTQITFEGDLIEGGAVVTATMDDVPQDIKDLIECGVFTEEEALAKCSENGNREQRMVLRKPLIRLVGEDGQKAPVIQVFPDTYTEEDLMLDIPDALEEADELTDTDSTDDATETEESATTDGSMDWLNSL